jgi:phenylpropionate dioxygenase-like ring-hydroxylating dioxygenase large terminal subunit
MNHIADNAEDLLAAVERGESLPAHWYTDPAIGEREIVEIFRKTWNYVGRSNR